MLAQALCDEFDITVIECGAAVPAITPVVVDEGQPAITQPHVAHGLGGTTSLWHNGLIEIEGSVFDTFWPIAKSAVDPYYERALPLLSGGVKRPALDAAIQALRTKYRAAGLPDGLLPGLYYPRWPLNVWQGFKLDGRVRVSPELATDIEVGPNGEVAAIRTAAGRVPGDIFVLAAGGLGTPLLLQCLEQHHTLAALQHAGAHYEDHPMTFVGELQLDAPLYRLWNYRVQGAGGNLRMPLVVTVDGLHVSFQLRPAATVSLSSRRQKVDTVLNQLRRRPWNPLHYLQLLRHPDDLLDILSFVFGIHLPTRHYTLLMVAQMPARDERDVWAGESLREGGPEVKRRWTLTSNYLTLLHSAIDEVLRQLGPIVRDVRIFKDWAATLKSAAHHSGTARMSVGPETGVCDANAQVHGMKNLFVCDGSLIPASGIANTGLTIAALALRLADHLKQTATSRRMGL